MFFNLRYDLLGFSDNEWWNMTRGDKCLVRDYVLNGYDETQTLMYDEYESARQVRHVTKKYDLEKRPRIALSHSDFHFQCTEV